MINSSKFLLGALGAPLLILTLLRAPAAAAEVRAFDKNGDGRPDKWAFFEGEWPTEIRYDRDFDGVVDEWEFLSSNGRMRELREDRNLDGQVDRVVVYDNGRPSYRKVDDDFDGRFDAIVFYDATDDVRTVSPELLRLLATQAGHAPRQATPAPRESLPALAAKNSKRPAAAEAVPESGGAVDPALLTSYFNLADPDLLVPKLGSRKANSEWNLEHNSRRFFGLLPAREFQLQHVPTGGTLWLERIQRINPDKSDESVLKSSMESFAGKLKRRVLANRRGETRFRTPFGPGLKRLFDISERGQSEQVALYVLAGPKDIVYLRSSGPSESFPSFERLSDAIVFGVRIGRSQASLQ